MSPDSWQIDKALVAKLMADTPLMNLAIDGVWRDIAPQNATRFVIFSLTSATDESMFMGRAFDHAVYLVKFVEKNTSDVNANAGAGRIDVVLDGAQLTVSGYSASCSSLRDERVGYTELDEANARWQHRGGLYEVWASP